MAAPMKRVVGWIDRLEWVHVYDELYSTDPTKQKHALDRISVWKCRAQNKLSTAIECTWELTSAELQYHWSKEESSLAEQDKQLRIIYAMALTRFINLITEKGQNARYAFPVHQLANDLCLPEWMVSLRHDSVHSNLPSLAVLKTGVQTALAWLKVEYWEAQLAEEDPAMEAQLHARPEVPDSETAEIMAQMLEAYTSQYYGLHTEKGTALSHTEKAQLKPILIDMEKLIASSNREVALAVLLQDGFMLHTAEQLMVLGVDVEALLNDNSLRLPAQLFPLWCPLIHRLHRLRALPHLLTLLVSQDAARPDIYLRQAAGWVVEVLIAANPTDDDGSEPVQVIRTNFSDGDFLNITRGRRLLTTCLEHPNRYTTAVLPHLFKTANPPLSKIQEQLLRKSVAIYTRTDIAEQVIPAEDVDIYDISNFDIGTKPLEWEDCPLGHCPNVPVTYTSLELPETVNHLGSPGGHLPLARPPATPGRTKVSRPFAGKRKPKGRPEENFDSVTKASLEWSASQLNSIKEQISLF